ncbi:MAG: M20/M25/M40 family metallo-hydrolase [Acidobacteriia bacterium]|nr:M20/M25/M40 family metallo-hydrolase [Terriglobia bacterium]
MRQYLVAQLSSLGMAPKVFIAIGTTRDGGRITAGETHDILGRLKGTANSHAVMLVAHYDSGYHAPGAADDGAGVAAILETIRALRAGPALRNDLIVLFTDGEEAGLLGAEAFFSSHPWMKDAGLILNFEARGNQGVSLLFETSSGNQALIKEVSQAAPHPTGSSLFYALYKILPNDTDFTEFRRSKIAGLNFAFGAGFDAYHSRLDTLNNLSLASLQHHGSYALPLTRHFAELDLTRFQQSTADDIFFNPVGSIFIGYSENWVIPEQIAATILLVFAVAFALARRELKVRKLLLALLPGLLLLVIVPLALGGTWRLLSYILKNTLIVADSPSNAFLLIGLLFEGAAISCLVYIFFAKRFSVRELAFGALIFLSCLSWALALALPAGSYLLFWPFLLMTLGIFVIELQKKGDGATAKFVASLASLAAAVLFLTPLIYQLYVFLTLQTIVVIAAGTLISIFFLIAAPAMQVLVPPSERWARTLVILLFLCSLACTFSGIQLSHYTGQHPRRDSIFYGLNADDHTAIWMTSDQSVDQWTGQFFPLDARSRGPMPACFTGYLPTVFTSPAPASDLAPPIAEARSNDRDGDARKLHLIVRSVRGAYAIHLAFADDIKVSGLTVNGRDIAPTSQSDHLELALYGMRDKEVDLRFQLLAPSGISFQLADESVGLPASAPFRPLEFVADFESDTSFVCRKYVLP